MGIKKTLSYIVFYLIFHCFLANKYIFASECPEEIRQALAAGTKCEDLSIKQQNLCCKAHQNSLSSKSRNEILEKLLLDNEISEFDRQLKEQDPPLEPEEIEKLFEIATTDHDRRSITDDRSLMSTLLSYFKHHNSGCLDNYVNIRSNDDLIITPLGICTILHHFKDSQLSLPFTPLAITENLASAIRQVRSMKGLVNQAIIFNRKLVFPSHFQSLHTSMLLIRKGRGKCTIINVDSNNENQDYLEFVKETILDYMPPECKLYTFNETRQSDSTNCPVFAISDYLEHSKNSLFDYIDAIEKKNQLNNQCKTRATIKELGFFPPSFMTVTQSLAKIRQYIHDSSQEFDQDSFDLLSDKVNNHTKIIPRQGTSQGKATNLLIHHQLKSYLNILLKECINERHSSHPRSNTCDPEKKVFNF